MAKKNELDDALDNFFTTVKQNKIENKKNEEISENMIHKAFPNAFPKVLQKIKIKRKGKERLLNEIKNLVKDDPNQKTKIIGYTELSRLCEMTKWSVQSGLRNLINENKIKIIANFNKRDRKGTIYQLLN